MPVNVIGTLKPKNNGKFPVAEAVDIKVTDDLRLDKALENKADLSSVNFALNNKADKTTTTSLQNQINNIIEPVTEEAEVINAREGADGTSYQTLKARLDGENAKVMQFRGELSDLNYSTIAEATQIGCYNSRSTTTADLSDKPDGVTGPFSLYVSKWSSGDSLGTVQLLISSNGAVYQRFISLSGTIVIDWASTTDTSSQFRGELAALGYTSISQARKIGCYSSLTATTAVLPDKPDGVTGAFSLIVNNWLSDGSLAPVQILITRTGDVWQRFLNDNGNVVIDWASSAPTIAEHTESITEIKSEIYEKANVSMGLTYGKFWDISGEVAELKEISSWYASEVIPVSEGEVYTVYADQGSSHKTRIWTLCDDELNILARAEDIYDDIMVEETFVVPHGATKLVISHKSNVPNVPYLKIIISKFNPLKGLKLSLLGDSISAYAGTIPDGNDAYYTGSNSGVSSPDQMWWNVLCSKTGITPLVINGWSGSGITQLTDSAHLSKVPMSDTSRCQALHSGNDNPDIILIAGGVNDYTYAEQSSQIPSNWDGKTAPVNGNSFTETYAVMIKNIQNAYPQAIVICLSTWFTMRGTDNGYTLINNEDFTQSDYDREIERVASLMRVPFINVAKCGFNRNNFYPNYAQDSSTIPTHPNAAGQKVMGEYIAELLPQLVKAFKR